MADPAIFDAPSHRLKVTLNGTVSRFDLLSHNGTNWVQADASDATLPAQLIAAQAGVSGDVIEAYTWVQLFDSDAPYTEEGLQYLSETAGAFTATRPTTAGSLRQVVGTAITDELLELRPGGMREVVVPWEVKGATSAFAQLDSGDYGGPTLDAQNEVALLQQNVPENAISVVKSVLRVAAEATVGTPTADITISSNLGDDTAWDAVTADATLADQATEGTNADDITEIDLSTGLDATDIIKPGATLGMRVLKDDAGTDVIHILGGYTVYKVVG